MKYQHRATRVGVSATQFDSKEAITGGVLSIVNGMPCCVVNNQIAVPMYGWLLNTGGFQWALDDTTFKSLFTKMEFEDAVPKEG